MADACDRTRLAFNRTAVAVAQRVDRRLQPTQTSGTMSPLADMERTLDEIALAVPGRFNDSGESGAASD